MTAFDYQEVSHSPCNFGSGSNESREIYHDGVTLKQVTDQKWIQDVTKTAEQIDEKLDSEYIIKSGKRVEIAHRSVTSNDINNIVNKASCQHYLSELELRDCGLKATFLKQLLTKVKKRMQSVKFKIDKLSITATDGIGELIPIICELMHVCQTTKLNLQECSGDLSCLYENLKRFKVDLVGLDLSYWQDLTLHNFKKLLPDLEELVMVNCGLDSSLFQNMNVTKSKVRYLDLSFNDDIDEDAIQGMPSILGKDLPVTLILEGCNLTRDEILTFKEFDGIVIERLDLRYNDALELDGVGEVGKIAKLKGTQRISLSSCHIDKDCLTSFLHNLDGHKLKVLDLSQNIGISDCSELISLLVNATEVKELNLSNCRMMPSQIKKLATSSKQSKLSKLNLSDNERVNLEEDYVSSLGSILENLNCEIILALRTLKNPHKQKLSMHFDTDERVILS